MVGTQSSNTKPSRWWCVALAILVAVIIGLIAAIVIINFNKSEGGSEKTGEPETEEQISLGDFIMNMNYAAKEFYEKDPSNIDAIIDVYTKSFNQMVAKGDYSFAYVIFQEEYTYLNKINVLPATILDALLKITDIGDFENFGYVSQYNICYKIIEIAKKVNDISIVERYQPYLDEARPFYERHLEATANDVKRYEEESQNINSGEENDK